MMKMVCVSLCVFGLMAASVMAQGFVLPIGETAAPVDAFRPGATVGFDTGDDTTYIGARGLYGPMDNLTLFGELGSITVDMGDEDLDGITLAVGGTLGIPLELPVDVAVRGSLIKPIFDDVSSDGVTVELSMWAMILQGVASLPIEQVPGLTAYAAGGFAYISTEEKASGMGLSVSHDDSETELALAVGANMVLGNMFNLFAELSHVDDTFFGAGASILF